MANTKQKFIINLSHAYRTGIEDGLLRYGKVKVVGLGIFELRHINSRSGRNTKTGDIMQISAYQRIKFRPTASLKKNVCKK